MRENPPAQQSPDRWNFRLYVAGLTPRSLRAFINLKAVCEQFLRGRYEIQVVDLTSAPEVAVAEHIVALPTVVRKSPQPPHRVVGDLSDVERVVTGLGIEARLTA